MNLTLTLSEADLERLKEQIKDELRAEAAQAEDPWLGYEKAAAYMDCPVSRVHALKSQGDLPFEKDGSRVVFRRSVLDEFIRGGGAVRRGGANRKARA